MTITKPGDDIRWPRFSGCALAHCHGVMNITLQQINGARLV